MQELADAFTFPGGSAWNGIPLPATYPNPSPYDTGGYVRKGVEPKRKKIKAAQLLRLKKSSVERYPNPEFVLEVSTRFQYYPGHFLDKDKLNRQNVKIDPLVLHDQ